MPKTNLEANAIALVALKSYAGRNSDRKAVADGENYPDIDLVVSGKVGKKPVKFAIAGRLSVGQANPTGSTKRPATDALLASVLSYLPKTKLKQLQADVEAGKLPEPTEPHSDKAALIIKELSTTRPRAGSVSFVEVSK